MTIRLFGPPASNDGRPMKIIVLDSEGHRGPLDLGPAHFVPAPLPHAPIPPCPVCEFVDHARKRGDLDLARRFARKAVERWKGSRVWV